VGVEKKTIEFSFNQLPADTDGYLLLRADLVLEEDDLPIDGNGYNVNSPIGNSTVVAKITDGTKSSHTLTNQQSDRLWKFALVPYKEGSNDATTNYKLDGVPIIEGVTIPTLGEWGMIAFGGLMLLFGINRIRKII
jgi:hypothetical protein